MNQLKNELPSSQEKPAGPGPPDGTAELSRVVARLKTLPSYHPTVVALLAVTTESQSAVEEFEAVFQTDPAFASELLQVANSPEFGLQGRIEDIRHALMLLGLERVGALAFSLAMQFYMNRVPSMRDVRGVWSHGIATAIVAEAMAEACDIRSSGIYTAGLVHDLGRLGLLMTEGEKYVRFSAQEFPSIAEYLSQEAEAVVVTHTQAGGVMADKWGLPGHLRECIRHHHDPAGPPLDETVTLVGCACRLAASLGYGEVSCQQAEVPEEIIAGLPTRSRGRPPLNPGRLQSAIAKALQGAEWQHVQETPQGDESPRVIHG